MDGAPSGKRRLWIALAGLSTLALVLVLAIAWAARGDGDGGRTRPADPFARGPFLTRLSETGARLRWTLAGDGGRVELSAAAPDGSRVTAQDGTFSGLAPGTRYRWTAAVDGRTGATGSFLTAPPDLSRPVTFTVFGDYGSGNAHERAVGRVTAAQRPAFHVTTGDNSYLVAAAALLDRNLFRPLRELMRNAPLWADLGDHDAVWRNGRDLIDALDSPGDGVRFAVRYGPIQIVVLGVEVDPAAIRFARTALRQGTPARRFVVVHKPIQPGSPIVPLLRRTGVDAVFSGHLHRYERRVVDGILTFTVGTGGQGPGDLDRTRRTAQARVSLLDYGVLRVDAGADGVRFTFVDERGRVLDRFRT